MNTSKFKQLVKINIDKDTLLKKFREVETREVVAYISFLFGVCLAIIISILLFIGAFNIIWEEGKEVPSASASIQLAFVSTALGGVVLWYVTHISTKNKGESSKKRESRKRFSASQRRGALMVGTMLLFSAMCFTLFALLCPFFPSVKDATDFLSVVIKYTSVLSLMAGSITLGFSLCLGILNIWSWSLTKD